MLRHGYVPRYGQRLLVVVCFISPDDRNLKCSWWIEKDLRFSLQNLHANSEHEQERDLGNLILGLEMGGLPRRRPPLPWVQGCCHHDETVLHQFLGVISSCVCLAGLRQYPLKPWPCTQRGIGFAFAFACLWFAFAFALALTKGREK